MVIYFYLFVTFLYVLTADSVSVRGRNVKNDLVPYLSSRLESLRKDANSLKVLSNEPFVIQFRVPPDHDGGREDKGRDKKKRRPSKKRFPKLKSLRKKHRIRRDVQIPVVETASGYQTRKSNRPENTIREVAKPKNSTNHIWTVYDIKTSARQKELMRDFAQALQKDKSINKHKEPKILKKDDGKNSLDKLRQKPDISNRIVHRPNVPTTDRAVKPVHSTTPKADERTSSKYTSRDLKADRERVEGKMKFLANLLSSNDSAAEGPRVRRKAESDRVVNKIAKMFLTLSAMNGMQDKRKSKCAEEEEDEDDVWTQERRNNPSKRNYSSNEERYKFKKWIEQMKSKRTSRTCPCMTEDYDENDIFPLEQKLSKGYPPLQTDKSSEEVSSESFREKNSFYPSTKSTRNFLYRPKYSNTYEDLDKKLMALTTRGRRKLELPMEDLELYRSRAKQILQNAEDILDKIREEEQKRQVAPNVLLSQLKELTSRIQPDPRNNENDFMRLIQKNLGSAKTQDGLDLNSITDNLKSFLVDPYEKAKALTDESTRKLSSYILKNFGKLNVSGDEVAITDKEHRQGDGQIYQGQEPQLKDGPLSSANLEKEPEKVSVSETVKPDIGPVTNFGEKKTDGVPEDATQDPVKQRMEQMLREQEEQIRNYTESPELSEGAEAQEKVAAQPEKIVDGVANPIESATVNEKDFGDPTTSSPEKPGDSKDEVEGKISGSDTEAEDETLKSVRESNLDDLTKSSETEGVTLKTVRESNLEDLNINDRDADGEDRQEGTFSERDENDVMASKYLQQPDYFKESVKDENDEKTQQPQILEGIEKAMDKQEPREDDDKVQEMLSESNPPEVSKTESEETLGVKDAPEETGKEQEAGEEVSVVASDPETTATDSDRDENDVIASKHLMKEEAGEDKVEEMLDKLREESQEKGSKEQPELNEPEKPREGPNETKSKESVGEILDEDPDFMDPEIKSKAEIAPDIPYLTNDEILEKSLKEGETDLREAIEVEDLPNEENKEPEGVENKEAGGDDVVQTPAEGPTQSASEEQQGNFLVPKLEGEELEDKIEALNKSEKIEDEDLKNEDETAKAEDLLKVGKLLETDEAQLGIQENENHNENESGESQVSAANPSQQMDEVNLGEDSGVAQRGIDPDGELLNQEEGSEKKDEGEEISLRAENSIKDQAENPTNINEIDENLNGDERDDAVLEAANANADDQGPDFKNDEKTPLEKTNSGEESNGEANDSIDTDETPLRSANPVEEIEAEAEETNVEGDELTQAPQSSEVENEDTNKDDETPLKSAHQELEIADGNTDVEDEASMRADSPLEAEDEENNQEGETPLKSVHQELEVADGNTDVEDEANVRSDSPFEAEDEENNQEGETPLKSAHQELEIADGNTDVEDEANVRSDRPFEAEDEDTNKDDETPLMSAHEELEVADGNTVVEDEANVRSDRPFEAEDEENNQEGETPLKSAHQELEVADGSTVVEDEANVGSDRPFEAEDEDTNKDDETPLKSAHQELELADGNTVVEDEANVRSDSPLEADEENNQGGEATLRSEPPDQKLQGDAEDANKDYTYLESENPGEEVLTKDEEDGNTGDETPLRAENPNEDVEETEDDGEDTLREPNPSGELLKDGNEADFEGRSVNLEADNQVAEEIEDENVNDETLLKATNSSQDPKTGEYQNLVGGDFEAALKAADPSLNSEPSKGKIVESTNENRKHESVRPANLKKLSRGRARPQSGYLNVIHSIASGSKDADHLLVPHEIGDIMKDIEGKNDDLTFKSLNPEHIDRFIHKIGKVEQQNIKEAQDEDCMKECGCSEAMHVRSRNLGKYEIVKDFLHWVKHIQLSEK